MGWLSSYNRSTEDTSMPPRIPVGIYEKALPYELTWLQRLDLAQQAGFDFVEMSVDESDERLARLDWSARERGKLREAIAKTGVPVLTMCLSGHRKYALGSASPQVRQQALDILHKAIDLSTATGIRIIQLAGYYVYYEPHDEGSLARYQESLAFGLEWASQAGVMLALENVDGNDIDSVRRAMTLVRAFNSPWFQIYPDIGNLAEHGLNVWETGTSWVCMSRIPAPVSRAAFFLGKELFPLSMPSASWPHPTLAARSCSKCGMMMPPIPSKSSATPVFG
jgi:predicted hexulose-6-phosphate isomerase